MLTKFDETVAKYAVKGRVAGEPIYAHVSSNALRHYYGVKRKTLIIFFLHNRKSHLKNPACP